jgi:hypothetical protein
MAEMHDGFWGLSLRPFDETQAARPQAMLPLLPDQKIIGTVTITVGSGTQSNVVKIYTPTGTPNASWAPVISSISSTVVPNAGYSGYQFNGLSQGAAYGDDEQGEASSRGSYCC